MTSHPGITCSVCGKGDDEVMGRVRIYPTANFHVVCKAKPKSNETLKSERP